MKTTQKRTKKQAPTLRHHVRHALVPHKGNHYRPHLVRLHGLTAILVLALLLQVVYGFATSGRLEVLGRVSNISSEELVSYTNAAREEAGIELLTSNPTLDRAAALKAQDMIDNDYWAHTSPTGVTPWKWFGDAGYSYSVAGENLAKNYPTASATVEAWMQSETHRENILNESYMDVGFAVIDGTIEGRSSTIIVALYGRPQTLAVAGTSSGTPTVNVAPVNEGVGNPLTYFGTALQSLTPATLGALALFTLVGAVAVAAHHYRQKLPVAWRKSWKVHHGMYTFVGAAGLAVLMILATGGGQI